VTGTKCGVKGDPFGNRGTASDEVSVYPSCNFVSSRTREECFVPRVCKRELPNSDFFMVNENVWLFTRLLQQRFKACLVLTSRNGEVQ
jgi:hypothetical protein